MELQGLALHASLLLMLLPLLASLGSAALSWGRAPAWIAAALSWTTTSSALVAALILMGQRLRGTVSPGYCLRELLPEISVGLLVDNLTVTMLVMVCCIALLIQIYSFRYLQIEVKHFPQLSQATTSRFFACLNLFLFAMLGLVLSASLVQVYMFWELVGLCSYLLIGFWYFKTSAALASRKAFVVTKFADLGFLAGVLALGTLAQSFSFDRLLGLNLSGISPWLLNFALIGLFCGAIGKSAQFPLHVWLPDAMEGPTPVSALIHAATMVAAGVYLVARCAPLYAQAPEAAAVVAWIGAITALVAATLALVQNDIKRILAYSTVSQLGFMMTALGAGATAAGTFHLITHAFFKALLFLGSGAVICACHSNNIWDMGGLRKHLPWTHLTFLVGSLALAGLPPLAGFWSKDEILAGVVHRPALLAVLALTALLTAFYVGRLYFVAFGGEYRGHQHRPAGSELSPPLAPAQAVFSLQPFWNEQRASGSLLPPECQGALSEHLPESHGPPQEVGALMLVPLLVLAVFALVLGWLGTPFHNYFAQFVFLLPPHHGEVHYGLMLLSTALATMGLGLAWWLYRAQPQQGEQRLRAILGRCYPVLEQRYYLDHLWAWLLAQVCYRQAQRVGRFDEQGVDGVVYGLARSIYQMGQKLRQEQSGQVQRYALTIALGLILLTLVVFLLEPKWVFLHPAPLRLWIRTQLGMWP